MATIKSSNTRKTASSGKAGRTSTAKSASRLARNVPEPVKLATLPDGHPALRAAAVWMDDYNAKMRAAQERIDARTAAEVAKRRRGLQFSNDQATKLIHRVEDLGTMLASVAQLGFWIDSSDSRESNAASVALDAVSILGALRADAIIRAMGGCGVGNYAEELAELTGNGQAQGSRDE